MTRGLMPTTRRRTGPRKIRKPSDGVSETASLNQLVGGLNFGYVILEDLGIFMFLAFHRLHAHVLIVYGADIISLVF